MEYVIGIALALAVSTLARLTGLDRGRAFYPTMVLVIASYYVLFAVLGASSRALAVESIAMGAFVLAAVLGFKRNLWLVAACLAGHGVFDLFHSLVVANPGVPEWWPAFCFAFDVGAAGVLAWLLVRSPMLACDTSAADQVALSAPAMSAPRVDNRSERRRLQPFERRPPILRTTY